MFMLTQGRLINAALDDSQSGFCLAYNVLI